MAPSIIINLRRWGATGAPPEGPSLAVIRGPNKFRDDWARGLQRSRMKLLRNLHFQGHGTSRTVYDNGIIVLVLIVIQHIHGSIYISHLLARNRRDHVVLLQTRFGCRRLRVHLDDLDAAFIFRLLDVGA